MQFKGYIEGYYGKLLSWKDRSTILKSISHLGMNLYIYAPKEDPYHRIKWSTPYPDDALHNFKSFTEEATKLGITPYFCLSPGISFNKGAASDLENLKEKFNQLHSVGFSEFGILFDDLEFKRDKYLAVEHGNIINEISQYLEKKSTNPLIFCPTVYCNSFADDDIFNSPYLKTLAEEVPSNLPMLWTGKNVVSESIIDEEIQELQKVISNPVLIWDNYYANDYCPTKFFIGPLKDRLINIENVEGFGLNGTGLSITDSIILSQLDGKLKTDDILKKFEIPDAFKQLMPFFYGPFDIVPDLSKVEDIDILIDLSNDLCIEWKSQLQLEWSPFLWDFFNNLRFLKKIIEGNDKKSLEAWALRRYSGPLNEIISRKLKKKGS
tara:strand:+ start:1387 stop:2526 length:1140 start_codon:yes stop_codon:yes gene_type:complete